ncbi:MAG: NAD(P)-dependent glycerol-1-phosphate dehydrogenase, partial [Methanomicrobiales archaeon]|nr:NAD(P)-dependent glycerol-1-phosphate dehydrogenase [Methanomicrobiales archaeon]
MSGDGMELLKNKGFDKSKWTQLPRDVVIGHDALTQL